MTWKTNDDRKLLSDFLLWLAQNGMLGDAMQEASNRFGPVDQFMKEREAKWPTTTNQSPG